MFSNISQGFLGLDESGQIHHNEEKRNSASILNKSRRKSDKKPKKENVLCKVKDPAKVGEGVNSYVTYKVRTKNENGDKTIVVRRYSDFLWLHDRLAEEYIEVIIPPVPEKVIVNPLGGDVSLELVEYRKKALEQFINRVMLHKSLCQSEYLKYFLTASEANMATYRSTIKTHIRPKAQEESAISIFTSTIFSFTSSALSMAGQDVYSSVKEIDLEFQENKKYFTSLHSAFESLQNKVAADIVNTRELTLTTNEFSQASEVMSQIEKDQDPVLSSYWKKLTLILKEMSKLQDILAKNETEILDDNLRDYTRMTSAGKVCLNNRLDLLMKLQEAQKKNASNVTALDREFKLVSANIKTEIENFNDNKLKDFKNFLIVLVAVNIEHYQKIVNLWKELLSDLEEY